MSSTSSPTSSTATVVRVASAAMSTFSRQLTGDDVTTTSPSTEQVPAVPTADPGLATERGTTTIAPKVIAAIARRAATEVGGVESVEATGLQGVLSSLRSSSAGGASADVAARRAAVDLRLAVRWPLPVHEVTMAAREHVRARVEHLTGHAVTDVDISVVDLPVPSAGKRKRVV